MSAFTGKDAAAKRPARAQTRTTPTPAIEARDFEAPIPEDIRTRLGLSTDETVSARIVGPDNAPVVVVLGGISAGRFVAEEPNAPEGQRRGWWSRLARVGGGVDISKVRVLGLDFTPCNVPTPIPITPADQAALVASALDTLGVQKVRAFVGASYGGMVGLAFARCFPKRLEQLVVASAAHRPHPMATAWRGVQRRILAFAAECGRGAEGVALARELAMTTYRTPEEFAERFGGGLTGEESDSDICGYLKSRGEAYVDVMSAARFTSLSGAIDRHCEDPSKITTPTLLIGADSDRLVPLEDMRELADKLAGPTRFVTLTSIYGHDSFLKETDALAPHVRAAIEAPLESDSSA
ncbi:MAG: homoserine O-succinyltransferase [Maricaulaceae bacterium]|jgi:homoserine O-acetyltransferase